MIIWLLLALLLVCSGTVSASETALFGLTRQELHRFHKAPGIMRRRVHALMERPRRVLMTVLLANTAINVAIFAVSFFALGRLEGGPLLPVVGGVAVLLAVIVFGEIVPKGLALAGRVRFAPVAAAMLSAIQVVVGHLLRFLGTVLVDPLTRLLAPSSPASDAVTPDELRLLVEQSADEGIIDSREHEMLQATVALNETSVREVMTPRVDLPSVLIDDDRETAQRKIRASGRRRLCVCNRDLDDIRGVLNARDLHLQPNAPVKDLIKPVHFVPEQADLVRLIRHFRETSIRSAVVVDEYGGTAGFVSIHDVAGRIVGELPEGRRTVPSAPPTERIDANTYRLSGNLSARLWADRFSAGEVDRQIDTLAGLVLSKLGRLPHVGDTVRIRNLELTVEAMDRRRIERVLVTRTADDANHTEAIE